MNSKIKDKWFQIENKSRPGLVLDVEGEKRGGRIILLPRQNNRITQLWTWKEHALLNFKGYVLDMQGGYSASGTFATAFDDYGGKNQKWKIKEDRIVSILNELTLDILISPIIIYPCIEFQPVSSQSKNQQSWRFLATNVSEMFTLNAIDNIETSKSTFYETLHVSKEMTLTKNHETVLHGPRYLEQLHSNVTSNSNHNGIKITDNRLSESKNSFINNFSIMQSFTSKENASHIAEKCSFSVSLPNVFNQQENLRISVDLQDLYFDDELQPSLQNDPNMQLIPSHDNYSEIMTSFQSCSIFDDTDSILSMDLSDEDPCSSTNESDCEENYNSCGN